MTFIERCERLKEIKGKHFKRRVKTQCKTFEKLDSFRIGVWLCKSVPSPQKIRVEGPSPRVLRAEGRGKGGCAQAKFVCV